MHSYPTMSLEVTFNKNQAIQVLSHNNTNIGKILIDFATKPNHVIKYIDEDNTEWSFIIRRRCHLFLMAKNQFMKKYEVIYSTSK